MDLMKLQSNGSGQVLPSAHASADINDEAILDKEAELASKRNEEAAAFQNKRLAFVLPP